MVQYITSTCNIGTSTTASSERDSVLATSADSKTPVMEGSAVDGLAYIRQAFLDADISQATADFLMESWRPGTRKQYSTYLTQFLEFASCNNIHLKHVQASHVLEFLHQLFVMGSATVPLTLPDRQFLC